MANELSVLELVLHNFLALSIRQAVLLHCWPAQTAVQFLRIASARNCYVRFVALDGLADFGELEVRFLARATPSLGVFLDLNCRHSGGALAEATRDGLFVGHNHWLALDRAAQWSVIADTFALHGRLSVDADFTYVRASWANGNAALATFTMHDVYSNGQHIGGAVNITLDREVVCTQSGCTISRYLSALHARTKYNNRNRMTDVTMRVGTVVTKRDIALPERDIVEFLLSANNTRIDNTSRFGFQRLMLVMDMLQCKYVCVGISFYTHVYIMFTSLGAMGGSMSFWITDRWSSTELYGGIVGALANGTVDITSTPLFITAVRLQKLRPVFNAGSYKEIALFRTPRDTVIQGGVFLRPFNTAVWCIFVALLTLAALLLWGTFRMEGRRSGERLSSVPSLLATTLIAFGSACIQGSNLVPFSTGGRLAFVSLSLFSFIMYNYYTSTVVSTLLGAPPTTNIKTLSDLANSQLQVAFEPTVSIRVFLNTSALPHIRRLVDRKIRAFKDDSQIWLSQDVGIPRVRDEPGFVYVMEALPGYIAIGKLFDAKQICDLNEIELRPDNQLHTHLNRNSTYIELMRLRDLRVAETGVYKKLFQQWIPSKFSCFDRNYIFDVGLEYTAPLFFLLFAVHALVLAILALERLTYHKSTQLHS